MDLAIDAALAQPTGDQLSHLTAEIDDQHAFVGGVGGGLGHGAPLAGFLQHGDEKAVGAGGARRQAQKAVRGEEGRELGASRFIILPSREIVLQHIEAYPWSGETRLDLTSLLRGPGPDCRV